MRGDLFVGGVDAFEHVAERSGNDSAQRRRIPLPLHCVCLARACLAVGEHRPVVALEHRVHDGLRRGCEHRLLPDLVVVHLHARDPFSPLPLRVHSPRQVLTPGPARPVAFGSWLARLLFPFWKVSTQRRGQLWHGFVGRADAWSNVKGLGASRASASGFLSATWSRVG